MNSSYNNATTAKSSSDNSAGNTVEETAENILDKGADAYEKAEHMATDVYDKTTQKVSETYEKAKHYRDDNPGKTIFIALGIGVGIGLLLGANSHHRSRTSRVAEPVVNALSDVALAFLR